MNLWIYSHTIEDRKWTIKYKMNFNANDVNLNTNFYSFFIKENFVACYECINYISKAGFHFRKSCSAIKLPFCRACVNVWDTHQNSSAIGRQTKPHVEYCNSLSADC